MATIQAQMLSGRYRTQRLCSLWSINTSEFCLLSTPCSSIPEDITHILNDCVALQPVREKMQRFAFNYCNHIESIRPIVKKYWRPSHPQFCQFLLDYSILPEVIVQFCQFLLDYSILPEVIVANQNFGIEVLQHLFHITRTFVYNLHKTRMKMLGRWNPF